MIIIKRTFRTAVHERNGTTVRICTGEPDPAWEPEDIAWGGTAPEDSLIICKRGDVSKVARVPIIANWALAVLNFVGMCYAFYQAMLLCLAAGQFIITPQGVLSTTCALIFVLYFRACLNPVVHDNAGHWINLRNGSSNLCGGIVIKRKARWP